ncbi:septal ring lytic transglycosylase RlpA family protein [Marinomonas ostreistagni]|uniref:septal ring lytic transglycosylase RlpA family protein n=1 Tax=Marinomonas ostreistagni TaxID=359209 RepID=UPI00194E6980|nr:septal ring lytic transglycosylase RlpA family protein [Marinomonas ostreistagni]MBM6551980.1 septal ring lytic transglycosylase RlpA family protein [Marinomonas ostreistagni]
MTRVISFIFLLMAGMLSACSSGPISRADANDFAQQGGASFYADKFQGRTTANGERFNQRALTAAHKRLPFGAKVRVTNLANQKTTVVRINDRGPFVKGRVIDLSKSAFQRIADTSEGVIDVRIEVIND